MSSESALQAHIEWKGGINPLGNGKVKLVNIFVPDQVILFVDKKINKDPKIDENAFNGGTSTKAIFEQAESILESITNAIVALIGHNAEGN